MLLFNPLMVRLKEEESALRYRTSQGHKIGQKKASMSSRNRNSDFSHEHLYALRLTFFILNHIIFIQTSFIKKPKKKEKTLLQHTVFILHILQNILPDA